MLDLMLSEFRIARGTSEPGDLGSMVGDPLLARLQRDMPPGTVRGYPVQYPADGKGIGKGIAATPPTPEQIAHQAIGPNDVVNRLTSQSKECPDEKFALVGYSQGGSVQYRAADLLKQKPELSEKVVAVVLYGAMNGSYFNFPRSKILANCAPGDMVSHV
jgi:cutinase